MRSAISIPLGFVLGGENPPPVYCLPGIYTGWVGVGWRRRCETRLSLRELNNQGTDFVFLAVTPAGGRVIPFSCGEYLNSAQGG